MDRFPRTLFAPALAFCLVACRQEQAPGPQVIYGGLGISNRLEVGMTLRRIGKNNDDLELTRIWKPDTWPWEKVFAKPQQFEATIPSLGANVWGLDESLPLGELSFDCQKLPPSLLRTGTNEISLSAKQRLSFDDIVRRFGRPVFVVDEPPLQRVPRLINSGQSVIWSNGSWASLFFPADGVFFHFRGNNLERFSIVRKTAGTNSVVNPL